MKAAATTHKYNAESEPYILLNGMPLAALVLGQFTSQPSANWTRQRIIHIMCRSLLNSHIPAVSAILPAQATLDAQFT